MTCKSAASARLMLHACVASFGFTFLTSCTHNSSISSRPCMCLSTPQPTVQSQAPKDISYILCTFSSLSRINYPADRLLCCVCRSGSSRPSRRLTRPSCQCCPPTNASSTTSASHPLLPPSNPPSMWARRAGSLLSHCRSDSLLHPICIHSGIHLGSPVLP